MDKNDVAEAWLKLKKKTGKGTPPPHVLYLKGQKLYSHIGTQSFLCAGVCAGDLKYDFFVISNMRNRGIKAATQQDLSLVPGAGLGLQTGWSDKVWKAETLGRKHCRHSMEEEEEEKLEKPRRLKEEGKKLFVFITIFFRFLHFFPRC